MRRVGYVLLASAALVWLVMMALAPMPTSPATLEGRVRDEGTATAGGLSLAVAEGRLHVYDAANGTSYVYVRTCGHSFCGVLVAFRGDMRGADLSGAMLLVPVEERLSVVPAPSGDPGLAEDHFIEVATQAYSSPFEVRSAWPLFLPRLLALGLATAGVGLAVRPVPLSALPSALALLAGVFVALQPYAIIFAQIAVFPLAIAALAAAIVALARKRKGWGAAGILLFAAAMLSAAFLAFAHFPPGLDA